MESVETPQPGIGEALVRVHAAAITRDELTWPLDRLPAIPSFEFSGVAATVKTEVDNVAVGDAVYALADFERNGAAADYIVVQGGLLAPKPSALSHIKSAALPLAALSAWQALFDHGKLLAGERVLVHGAAGGVGSLAVQLAHHHGAQVIATTSTANVETVRELGADQVVDHSTTRFEDAVGQVDLVFDTVGGDRLDRSLAVLPSGGRLVSVATEPPSERAATQGVTAVYFVVQTNREQLLDIAKLADNGELRPLVDQVFPLVDARDAFERSLSGSGRGKIVLEIVDET